MTALDNAPSYIATVRDLRIETRAFGVRIALRLTGGLERPHDAAAIAEQAVRERRPDLDASRLDWPSAFVQFAPGPRHAFLVHVPYLRDLAALEGAIADAGTWIGGRLVYEHENGARDVTTLRDLRWQHGSALPVGRVLHLEGVDFRCELHQALLTIEPSTSRDEIAVRTELGTRFTLSRPARGGAVDELSVA